MTDELITSDEIAHLEKLFETEIESDEDYRQLAEEFPEDE